MDNINKKIYDLYNSRGYFSRYGNDFFIAFFLVIITFYVVMYYNILNNIQPIKDDWANQRCSPSVIPFAGIINKPDDETNLAYTSSNFSYCIQNILEEVAQYALLPIYYSVSLVTAVYEDAISAINTIRDKINSIRDSITEEGEDLNNRALNIMIPIVTLIKKVSSIAGKIQGTLVSGLYTAYGGFITAESTALFIYEVVVNIMYIIAAFIVTCFSVGWLFPPVLATGLSAASYLAILMIPLIVMVVIMNNLLNAANLKAPPSIPSYCFAGDTDIETKDGIIKIKDLKLGTKLIDGSIITAVMKCLNDKQNIYTINNIKVSGNHKIFDNKNGWINVKYHNNSQRINYNEEFIYCIGTDTKIIKIDNYIFSDWDEIDDEDIQELKQNIDTPLKQNNTRFDIHKYLEAGLDGETNITLEDKSIKKLKDININDKLLNGNKVTAKIEIKTNDIKEYVELFFNNKLLCKCAKNTVFQCLNLGEDSLINLKKTTAPNKSYHLVCNDGGFILNNLFIFNYGKNIDKFLSYKNLNNPKLY